MFTVWVESILVTEEPRNTKFSVFSWSFTSIVLFLLFSTVCFTVTAAFQTFPVAELLFQAHFWGVALMDSGARSSPAVPGSPAALLGETAQHFLNPVTSSFWVCLTLCCKFLYDFSGSRVGGVGRQPAPRLGCRLSTPSSCQTSPGRCQEKQCCPLCSGQAGPLPHGVTHCDFSLCTQTPTNGLSSRA